MMKNDKYLRARGGTTRMIDVKCAKCGEKILFYQKDGPSGGWLKRCYLNRIFGIEKWEQLQHDRDIKSPADMPSLICDCGNLIGTPMMYKDGRLAFRLVRGSFTRRKSIKHKMMTKKYEIEVRGLLSGSQFKKLDKLFRAEGKFKYNKDRIGVCYPDPESGSLVEECRTDIRIRTTAGVPEIIVKQGEWGKSDESRRELSIIGKRGQFDELVLMLAALGHKKGIVVVRAGNVYDYKGVEFSLVEVPNHSFYFEAEVMVDDESKKPTVLKKINKICTDLGLEILSQSAFFDYINKLNKEANESFDFAKYKEGDFKKRFGI